MITNFVLRKYDKLSNGWSTSYNTITDAFNILVHLSIGGSVDSLTFRVPNNNNCNINNYNIRDKILCYYQINNEALGSGNLLINVIIKNVKVENNESGKFLIIECVSLIELLTNALVFVSRSNVSVPEFLAAAVQSVQLYSPDYALSFSMPSVKRDGSAFPKINNGGEVNEFYKTLLKIVDTYIQDSYTNDGNYYYYLDPTNTLNIVPRSNSVVNSWTEGIDFNTLKTSNDTSNVKNFVIIKCGNDLNNNPITTRYVDYASIVKNGWKYHIIVDTSIADRAKILYPSDNNNVIAWSKNEGSKVGSDFVSTKSSGIMSVSVTKNPTMDYYVGDKITIISPSYNLNTSMRIVAMSISIDGITFELEEEAIVI